MERQYRTAGNHTLTLAIAMLIQNASLPTNRADELLASLQLKKLFADLEFEAKNPDANRRIRAFSELLTSPFWGRKFALPDRTAQFDPTYMLRSHLLEETSLNVFRRTFDRSFRLPHEPSDPGFPRCFWVVEQVFLNQTMKGGQKAALLKDFIETSRLSGNAEILYVLQVMEGGAYSQQAVTGLLERTPEGVDELGKLLRDPYLEHSLLRSFPPEQVQNIRGYAEGLYQRTLSRIPPAPPTIDLAGNKAPPSASTKVLHNLMVHLRQMGFSLKPEKPGPEKPPTKKTISGKIKLRGK
jgi:hypothetical protein